MNVLGLMYVDKDREAETYLRSYNILRPYREIRNEK